MKGYVFGWILIALLAVCVGIFGFITLRELTAPPLLEFQSVATPSEPAKPGATYIVKAQTIRREASHCTNGPQVDMRDSLNQSVRLPVPARTIKGGVSSYALVMPDPLPSGRYGIKLRESFGCGGRPHIYESPWFYIEASNG